MRLVINTKPPEVFRRKTRVKRTDHNFWSEFYGTIANGNCANEAGQVLRRMRRNTKQQLKTFA